MKEGDGNRTAPWCLRCRRALRNTGTRAADGDSVSPRNGDRHSDQLVHNGCGGRVVHSHAEAKKAGRA